MTTAVNAPPGVEVTGPAGAHHDEVLTAHALAFVAGLHRSFNIRRQRLLADRAERQARFDAGELPVFLPNTDHVRNDPDWRVAPAPADLDDRRVEITGPAEPKMMINALNSRREGVHGRLRGRPVPHLGQRGHRPVGGARGGPPATDLPDR